MPSADWAAPLAERPVDAVVELPGSKSLTNRDLVLAALANGTSRLLAPLRSRDTPLMAAALRALGRRRRRRPTAGRGSSTPGSAARRRPTVDFGLAGTVMRFLPPVAALADGPVTFDGDPRARSGRWARCSTRCARSAPTSTRGPRRLPFTVHGTGSVPGGAVTIDASASCQFVSGLLLAGAAFDEGVECATTARPCRRAASRMTVEMLRDAGVDVDDSEPDIWRSSRAGRAPDVQSSPTCPARRRSSPPPWSPAAGNVPGWPRDTDPARRRAARPARHDGRRGHA